MAGEHDVTLGEVYRLVVSVQKDLRDLRTDLVGRAEYESDQEGIDRRFQGSAEVHAELKSEIVAVKTEGTSAVKEINGRLDAAEEAQKRNRQQWTLALVGIGATAIIGPIATILIQGSV